MKSAPFFYLRPPALDEAVSMLARLPDANVLAGGQSLMPLMNFRLASPTNIISLSDLSELSFIKETEAGLRIGAMTRQRMIERSELVADTCPLLSRAITHVGHQQTRNRGTLGGSLCHLDPAAELPLVAATLDARITIAGPTGLRTISFAHFAKGPLETDLAIDEIVTEVFFPRVTGHFHFAEVARRKGDFAIVSIAIVAEPQMGGGSTLRIAYGGLHPVPARTPAIEASLMGERLTGDVIDHAADMARALPCEGDQANPAAYRRHLAEGLLRRGLTEIAAKIEAHDGRR